MRKGSYKKYLLGPAMPMRGLEKENRAEKKRVPGQFGFDPVLRPTPASTTYLNSGDEGRENVKHSGINHLIFPKAIYKR